MELGSGMRSPWRLHLVWSSSSRVATQHWRQEGQVGEALCARRLAAQLKCSGCPQHGQLKVGSCGSGGWKTVRHTAHVPSVLVGLAVGAGPWLAAP